MTDETPTATPRRARVRRTWPQHRALLPSYYTADDMTAAMDATGPLDANQQYFMRPHRHQTADGYQQRLFVRAATPNPYRPHQMPVNWVFGPNNPYRNRHAGNDLAPVAPPMARRIIQDREAPTAARYRAGQIMALAYWRARTADADTRTQAYRNLWRAAENLVSPDEYAGHDRAERIDRAVYAFLMRWRPLEMARRSPQDVSFTCDYCDEITDETMSTGPGDSICPVCEASSFATSPRDGELYPHGHVMLDEDEDEDEDHDRDPDNSALQNYTARAEDRIGYLHPIHPHGIEARSNPKRGFVYTGIEIEAEHMGKRHSKSDCVRAIRDAAPFGLVIKSDGSLRDGLEIVTPPMPASMLTSSPFLDAVRANPITRRELRSHDTSTCGLHVHQSRAGFTPLSTARYSAFWSDPANYAFLKLFARREFWRLQYTSASKKKLAAHRHAYGRYEAVNLTNAHTVETRAFRGSLIPATIRACVELCDALRVYCLTASNNGLTVPAFLDWLNQRRGDWKHLAAACVRYGQIPPRHKPNPQAAPVDFDEAAE